MPNYTAEFNCTSGLSVTVQAYLRANGITATTANASVLAVEKSTDKGRYAVTYTTLATGEYRLNGVVSAVGGFVNEIVFFGATSGSYPVQSENAIEMGQTNLYKNTTTLVEALVKVTKP
jgi:hypothetical protein